MTTKHKIPHEADQIVEEIAKKHLFIDTLVSRNSDRLDFYDCGVASLRYALLAAYEAGLKAQK